MHRLVKQASQYNVFKQFIRPRTTHRTETATHSIIGGENLAVIGSSSSSLSSVTMKSSADTSSSNRRPLASLQTYPDFVDHEGTTSVSLSDAKTKVTTTTTTTTTTAVSPPLKATPPPAPKLLLTSRNRSGSAPPGSTTATVVSSVSSNPPPSSSSSSRGGGQLEQPYSLQRSQSTQPKLPHNNIMTPLQQPDNHRRARSYSSSAVASGGGGGGRTGSSSSNASSSLTSLLSTLDMRRHKYGETHPKVGSIWNRIGTYFFRSCQYGRALDAFKHAVVCYPVGEPDLACSYSNIGAVYWASGSPQKAIGFLEKALEIYELNEITEGRDPDECMAVASTLYQMGLCNTLRKQYNEALSCLKKCQKIQAALLPPRDIQVGRTLDAIGKVHFFKEEYSTALQCHEEARRIKLSASSSSGVGGDNAADVAIVTSLLNIAAVHHATKNWNVALKNYTKVMHLQKSELVRCRNQKGQPLLARAAQELGETMQLLGDLYCQMMSDPLNEQARRYFKEASLLYEEAGLSKDDPRVVALK